MFKASKYKPLKCLLLRLKIIEYRAIPKGRGYANAWATWTKSYRVESS